MGKMDRLNSSFSRLGADLSFRDLHIYNYTETYDEQTGESTWTKELHATIPGEVVEPQQPQSTQDASGMESTVDARIRVQSDSVNIALAEDDAGDGSAGGAQIVPAGVDGSHPTVVGRAGKEYTVFEEFDEGNGLMRFIGVEN